MSLAPADVLVVVAGAVGLGIARALRRRYPQARIVVVDKEGHFGAHASGRNSGVVHAGIYYPPQSLKARFCAAGSVALKDFCAHHAVPWQRFGKLIVPTTREEAARIPGLFENAQKNGAPAEILGLYAARRLEPEITPAGDSLLSPATACVDPKKLVEALARDFQQSSHAVLSLNNPVLSLDASRRVAMTAEGPLAFGFLVNAAGAHVDRIAQPFGCGLSYRILPFRGAYWQLDPAAGIVINGNIYPVPNPDLPFLGVHFTRSVAGKVYVGPTAMPALGRENYNGLTGISPCDLLPLLGRIALQYATNVQGFRRHAHQEGRYLVKSLFVRAAQGLVPKLEAKHLLPSTKRGIRPQLYDLRTRRLEMDFVVEKTPESLHVLNAISPGFTCALPFGEHLAAEISL